MDTRYLEQRRLGWYVCVDVPPPLVKAVGRKRLRKSLKTRVLRIAQLRRWQALDEMRQVIAKAAMQDVAPAHAASLDAAIEAGQAWRETLRRLQDGDESAIEAWSDRDLGRDEKLILADEAINQTEDELRSGIHGAPPSPDAAKAFIDAVKGKEPTQNATFKQAADEYVAAHKPSWRNEKHVQQWENTIANYAYPSIGKKACRAITTDDVLAIIKPLWARAPETASRLRGRIEVILDYAGTRGWRTGDNPARWKGHLQHSLPRKSRVAPAGHHAALPYTEIAAFVAELRGQEGLGALCLEWCIFTACRTGEAIGATWDELDLEGKVWTIPASRMKAGREHRVPLSDGALDVLNRLQAMRRPRDGQWLFPGRVAKRPMSNMSMLTLLRRMERSDVTVHGFRSSFRDWCAEATDYPSEVAEMALAHTIGNKVEAAYRRGDLREKRRLLMIDWAAYCARSIR